MKTTKKFLAIFLAMTVLFTVCSLSVFAANDPDYTITGTDYDGNDTITGEGRIWLLDNGRTIRYATVSFYDEECGVGSNLVYTLFAQCAIVYADGSSEVAYVSQEFMVRDPGDIYDGTITARSNKEIAMVCCEFQIFNASGLLWEGMLDISYANE